MNGIEKSNVGQNNYADEPEEQFDFSQYLRMLRRNKWIIIITCLLCLSTGFYVAKNTDPVYSAVTKILADPYLPNADREEHRAACRSLHQHTKLRALLPHLRFRSQ